MGQHVLPLELLWGRLLGGGKLRNADNLCDPRPITGLTRLGVFRPSAGHAASFSEIAASWAACLSSLSQVHTNARLQTASRDPTFRLVVEVVSHNSRPRSLHRRHAPKQQGKVSVTAGKEVPHITLAVPLRSITKRPCPCLGGYVAFARPVGSP